MLRSVGFYLRTSTAALFLAVTMLLTSAIDQTLVSDILNSTLPCGTSGAPAAFTALSSAGGMKLRLTSTNSSASAAGTTLAGTGYSDYVITTSSAQSSAGSAVTLPAVSGGTSWTNGSGAAWTVASVEIQDNTNTRAWFGNWNGDPISIANGDTFAVAQNAVSVSLA